MESKWDIIVLNRRNKDMTEEISVDDENEKKENSDVHRQRMTDTLKSISISIAIRERSAS